MLVADAGDGQAGEGCAPEPADAVVAKVMAEIANLEREILDAVPSDCWCIGGVASGPE